MEKEFDNWNKLKKKTNTKPDNFGIHEREIWWLSFGINVGVEIDGKHSDFERPALVIKKFNKQMAWVLPTTLQSKNLKFHEKFSFKNQEYFVAITQIRTVSTKRFLRKIGMVKKGEFEKIKDRIIDFIQKNENPPFSGFPRRPKP